MLVGLTAAAFAWTEPTERTLLAGALDGTIHTPEGAPNPDPGTADRVRRSIDAWARTAALDASLLAWSSSSDREKSVLTARWTARYPSPEAYDAWAFKDALG